MRTMLPKSARSLWLRHGDKLSWRPIIGILLGVLAANLVTALYTWLRYPHKPRVWKTTLDILSSTNSEVFPHEGGLDTLVLKHASKAQLDYCLSVLKQSGNMANQQLDSFLFHNFLKLSPDPISFLELNTGKTRQMALNVTSFYSDCLGWQGVSAAGTFVTSLGMWTVKKVERCEQTVNGKRWLLDNLSHYSSPNPGIREILEKNADVLGPRDAKGRYGLNIGLVSIDFGSGRETTSFLACTNIQGIFSTAPNSQVWTVRTDQLDESALRIADAALLFAGLAKVGVAIPDEKGFAYDIYLKVSHWFGISSGLVNQRKCPNQAESCPLFDVLDPNLKKGIVC